jgi:hypothetical protein
MSFTRYVCWKPERIDPLMDAEALQPSPADFLATHYPLRMYYQRSASDSAGRTAYTERQLLRSFLDEKKDYVFVPILGFAGTGKSHLVRWLNAHIPESDRRRVLLLPKVGTNLKDLIDRILKIRGTEGRQFDEFRKRVRSATVDLTPSQAREHLLNHLASAAGPQGRHSGAKPSEAQAHLSKELPNLLYDPFFRAHLLSEGGVIDALVAQAIGTTRGSQRSERQGFKVEDLPLDLQNVSDAGVQAKRVFQELSQLPSLAQAAVDWLNLHLDEAIARVFSLGGENLRQLMLEVRTELAKKKLELVILIEDFALLQGIDLQLLEALLVRPVQEGYPRLCDLRVALACNTGYFNGLPDTVKQRADFCVNMDLEFAPSQPGELPALSESDAVGFAARYLNAARLATREVESWFGNGANEGDLPTGCDRCPHREPCHASFGETGGVGLYPFNRTALIEMLRRTAERLDRRQFVPRDFLQFVVKDVLQRYGDDLGAGRFPPPSLHQSFGGTYRPALGPLVRQEIVRRDQPSAARRLTLLDLWSTADRAVDLDERIHTAFDLPKLGAEVVAEQPHVEPPTQPGADARDLTGGRPSNVAPATLQAGGRPVPPSDLLELIQKVSDWAEGRHSYLQKQVTQLRDVVHPAIKACVEWDAEMILSGSFLVGGSAPFPPRGINFPDGMVGQQGVTQITLPIPLPGEDRRTLAVALVALLLHSHYKDWSFPRGGEYQRAVIRQIGTWTKHLVGQIRRPAADAPEWDPVATAAQLLAIGQRLLGRPQASRTTLEAGVEALFFGTENIDFDFRAEAWKALAKAFVDRREKIEAVLLSRVPCTKGGADPQVIDASRFLQPLREVRRTGKLSSPIPASVESAVEFRPMADFARKLHEALSDAIRQEKERHVAWLARVNSMFGVDPRPHEVFPVLRQAAEKAAQAGVFGGTTIANLRAAIDEFPAGQQFDLTVKSAQQVASTSDEGELLATLGRQDLQPAMAASLRLLDLADQCLSESIGRGRERLNEAAQASGDNTKLLEDIGRSLAQLVEMSGAFAGSAYEAAR